MLFDPSSPQHIYAERVHVGTCFRVAKKKHRFVLFFVLTEANCYFVSVAGDQMKDNVTPTVTSCPNLPMDLSSSIKVFHPVLCQIPRSLWAPGILGSHVRLCPSRVSLSCYK